MALKTTAGDVITGRLDNGLTILSQQVADVPVAAIFVWYRVGARNEMPGATGLSHWVEHMLFKGTPKYGKGVLDKLITSRGGQWNAFTSLDYTAYYQVLPSEHIELALDIESDRMVNALFDPAEVESERTVIISERQGAENYPGFWLSEGVLATAFQVHPYRQGVIGSMADLRSITRDQLYDHYRRYYVPDNAVLVAVGDFDTGELHQQVERYFGGIPAGGPVPPVSRTEPPQMGERRITIRRPGPAPYLDMLFPTPAASAPDTIPLLVLDGVLSGGKGFGRGGGGMGRSSRFYTSLVRSGLASRASSGLYLTVDPGMFSISASLLPGADPRQVEETIVGELAELAEDGPAKVEVERAKKQMRARLAYGSMDGVMGQAMLLGRLAMLGMEERFHTLDDLFAGVEPGDVQRVAAKYCHPDKATIGWFLPTEAAADEGEDVA